MTGSVGNCIPDGLICLNYKITEICKELKKASARHNIDAKNNGVRSYRQVQNTFRCVLHPCLELSQLTPGMHLLHIPGLGEPHCVSFLIEDNANTATYNHRDSIRTIDLADLHEKWSGAVDSEKAILFFAFTLWDMSHLKVMMQTCST
jgi:hypothetical protein